MIFASKLKISEPFPRFRQTTIDVRQIALLVQEDVSSSTLDFISKEIWCRTVSFLINMRSSEMEGAVRSNAFKTAGVQSTSRSNKAAPDNTVAPVMPVNAAPKRDSYDFRSTNITTRQVTCM